MIYLDTSVALAHLLGEQRAPDAALWAERVVSSRILEYEVWVRVHARGLARTHGEAVRDLVASISLLELTPLVLARALEPFPVAVRTLDALHLASMLYLEERGESIQLASYDGRLSEAAGALGIAIMA